MICLTCPGGQVPSSMTTVAPVGIWPIAGSVFRICFVNTGAVGVAGAGDAPGETIWLVGAGAEKTGDEVETGLPPLLRSLQLKAPAPAKTATAITAVSGRVQLRVGSALGPCFDVEASASRKADTGSGMFFI